MLTRFSYLTFLVAAGCGAAHHLSNPSADEADRAAVYAAAIEHLFVTPATSQIVVAPKTQPVNPAVGSLQDTSARMPLLMDTSAALPETWRDFELHNREAETVPRLDLSVHVEYVESPRYADPRVRGGPVLVDFPGAQGLVWLSGIGFDSARHEAIVSVFQSCGPLCGHGGLLVLERTSGGKWIVRRQLTFIQA